MASNNGSVPVEIGTSKKRKFGRTARLGLRLLVWACALVVGGSLGAVAYFVNWAAALFALSLIMMFGVLHTARKSRREREMADALLADAARDRDTVIEVLFGVLGLRDGNMAQSERVANLAAAVAWQLGLREEEVRRVKEAALLHDVGKKGIAASVLSKPGELSAEEWAAMRRHAEAGYQILSQIDFLRGAADIIHHHHERFDGQGYPLGLKGDQIPIGSRIFAVVDSYVAMTSDRPYRKKMAHDIAIKEIVRNSLTQFDPEVVAAFLQAEKHGLLAAGGLQKDGLIASPVSSEV